MWILKQKSRFSSLFYLINSTSDNITIILFYTDILNETVVFHYKLKKVILLLLIAYLWKFQLYSSFLYSLLWFWATNISSLKIHCNLVNSRVNGLCFCWPIFELLGSQSWFYHELFDFASRLLLTWSDWTKKYSNYSQTRL